MAAGLAAGLAALLAASIPHALHALRGKPPLDVDVPAPLMVAVVPDPVDAPTRTCVLTPGQPVTWLGSDESFGEFLLVPEAFGGSDCQGGDKVIATGVEPWS